MPRVTRVPGHTTLTPSPLMRRKPQHVTLAADLVDRPGSNAALTTPPRATSPTSGAISASMSNTLSPNTRLTKMVHEGTVTIGGVGGGPLAAITTLKSDLVMLQSEIDATVGSGGRGGALELQSTLARFGGSADERTNLETCNTLLSLVLLKINELCRLHGSLPATAPRQSRVGDVVSLFRGLRTGDRNADAGVAGHDALLLQARSPSQRPSVSSSSQAVVAGLAAPRSSNTHRASDMVEDIAWDIPSSQPHHRRVASGHLDMSSDPPSPTAGLSRAVTSGGMPIPLHEAQRKASGSLAEGSITKYPTQQQPAARAAGSNTSPGLPASPRSSPAPAVTATAPTLPHDVRAHIARLEKQLQLFKYLERAMHVVDTFDNTMKHCTMNESLKELGIDMAQLMSSAKITLPPHTVTKAGVFRSAVTVRPPAGSPAGGLVSGESAPSPSMASSSPQHASSPEASVNPLTNNTLTSAAGGDDGSVTDGLPLMPETQAVATLKALISFQNAVVSLLLAEMKAQKAAQQHQLAEFVGGGQAIAPLDLERSPSPGLTASLTMVSPRELSDKIKRLEDALAQRNEQIAAERQLHFLRHERAANVILAERARSSTPGAGASRPNTTLTSLSSMEWSRPATTNVVARTLALPPVPSSVSPIGAPSPIPILATRPEDVPGATELIFRKTIAQQGEIIKDLQRRVATPDVGTRGGAALQQPSAKATVL